MLIPAANAIVYNIVFRYVMKVDIPNYLVLILSGLIPWAFFSTALTNGMESLVGNQSVLNKVPIPSYSFTLAEVLTAFTNLILSIPVITVVVLFSQVDFSLLQLFIPLTLVILLIQAYGIGLILAYAFVYFRDLRHLLGIVIQIWFYLTPILYRTTMIPEEYRFVLFLNPVASLFQYIHMALGIEEFSIQPIFASLVWTIIIMILSLLVLNKLNDDVVESL